MSKKAGNSVVDLKRYDYKRVKVRGADGRVRHSMVNGDSVSKALLLYLAGGGTLGAVIRDNGLANKYTMSDAVNQGLIRMSVGNSLRAKVKAGDAVHIGKIKVTSLRQTIDLPKVAVKPKKIKKRAARRAKPATTTEQQAA